MKIIISQHANEVFSPQKSFINNKRVGQKECQTSFTLACPALLVVPNDVKLPFLTIEKKLDRKIVLLSYSIPSALFA